jgi:hypothetical protein
MKQTRPPKRRRKLPSRASKTDARSNRPRREHVEVKGVPGAGTAPVGVSSRNTGFPGAGHDADTTAARIAALPPRASNAVLAPVGTPETPTPLREKLSGGTLVADSFVIPAPVLVVPTVYPENPATGTVIVQNHITINVDGADFGALITKLDELRAELRRSQGVRRLLENYRNETALIICKLVL